LSVELIQMEWLVTKVKMMNGLIKPVVMDRVLVVENKKSSKVLSINTLNAEKEDHQSSWINSPAETLKIVQIDARVKQKEWEIRYAVLLIEEMMASAVKVSPMLTKIKQTEMMNMHTLQQDLDQIDDEMDQMDQMDHVEMDQIHESTQVPSNSSLNATKVEDHPSSEINLTVMT